MFNFKEFNGSTERQSDTTHVVSMAHVPDGEYDRTQYVTFFFSSKEEAEAFAKPYMAPPECPIILTIAQHESVQAMVEKHRESQRQDYGNVDPYDRHFDDGYQV